MLTPCKAGEHWVTIELCDEVRVEAVEIAVWEFFSGIVREVKVSAGEEEGEQTEVGTFIGKNVRGVQVSQIVVTADVDLFTTCADVLLPVSSTGLSVILRIGILLSRISSQGVWNEPARSV